MSKLIPITLLALALPTLAGAAPKGAPAKGDVLPFTATEKTLPNGLKIIVVPTGFPNLVSVQIPVQTGSRNEIEPGKSGFAHFFEHMMFRGTKAYPPEKYQEVITRSGARQNAYTSDDLTNYHTTFAKEDLETILKVEADRFQNLEYSEPAFRTEAQAVLGEYHKSAANPSRRLDELLATTAFSAHTYKHTTLGFYDDIKAMPGYYEYSKQFFRRWYTPDNATIFVVGDFDDAKVMAAIRQHYGTWTSRSADVKIPVEPRQTAWKEAHLDWPSPTLPRHLHAWHVPGFSTSNLDSAVRDILGEYLVGQTSPVYKELVLEKGLAEQVGVWSGFRRDPNLFSILAVMKTEAARNAVQDAFNKAVNDLAKGRVDAQRVKEIQSNARYAFLMSLETPADVAVQLSWYTGVGGSPQAMEKHFQNMAQVKPADLVEYVKKHLQARNRTMVSLTPKAPAAQGGDK
ncbi:MAG: M16 family metallopeptidase [Telluria sp.]